MPLYDFTCSKCGKTQEFLVKVGDVPVCCKGAKMTQEVSIPGGFQGLPTPRFHRNKK